MRLGMILTGIQLPLTHLDSNRLTGGAYTLT